MGWVIDLRPGEVLTVNGCRIIGDERTHTRVVLVDQADVVLPSGKVCPRRGSGVAVEDDHDA